MMELFPALLKTVVVLALSFSCIIALMTMERFILWRLLPENKGKNPELIPPLFSMAVKFFSKETPHKQTEGLLKKILPPLLFVVSLLPLCVVPFFGIIETPTEIFYPEVMHKDFGLIFIYIMMLFYNLVYIFTGEISNTETPTLGGTRLGMEGISAVLILLLTYLSLYVAYGTLDIHTFIHAQKDPLISGFPLSSYGFLLQPISAIIYLGYIINYFPGTLFDARLCNQEVLGGRFLDYYNDQHLFIVYSRFFHLFMSLVLYTMLFLGGYNPLPFLDFASNSSPAILAITEFVSFFIKIGVLFFVLSVIKTTLIRLRHDQKLNLYWKYFLPLGFINLILTIAYLIIQYQY